MQPFDVLKQAMDTNKAKSEEYGDSYLQHGPIMSVLFKNGVALKNADDLNRYHLFLQCVIKLTRYAENWSRGGHQDSIRDLIVYAAMLESADFNITGGKQNGTRSPVKYDDSTRSSELIRPAPDATEQYFDFRVD